MSTYDPNAQVIQLGSGTYKSTGEFTFGSGQAQAIATRASSITNDRLLKWDNTNKTIVDAGVALSSLLQTTGAQSAAGVKTFSDGIKLGTDTTAITGVETTPAQNSTKVVTSGGIYTALSNKQASNATLTSLAGVSTSSTGLLKITNGTISIDDTGFGTGTVTSVALRNGSTSQGTITVSGSPITTSGTIDITLTAAYGDTVNPYGSKTKSYVLAAPSTGAGAPSFRALVATDLPGTYAGSSSAGGAATSAEKLTNTSKIGDTNKPVYFKADGTPAAIDYTISKSVPADALFTDHQYSAATTSAAGLMPALNSASVTTQSQSTKFLREDGTWAAPSYTSYSVVAGSTGSGSSGLIKLSGATVSTQSQSTKFMREDGTWAAPSYTTNSDTWRKVQLNGTDKLGTGTNTSPLNIVPGNYMSITESSGAFTFAVDAASAMTDNKPVLASTVNTTLSNYVTQTGTETISGAKTFTGANVVQNTVTTYKASANAAKTIRIKANSNGTDIAFVDGQAVKARELSIDSTGITLSQHGSTISNIKSVKLQIADTASITSSESYTITVPLPTQNDTMALMSNVTSATALATTSEIDALFGISA